MAIPDPAANSIVQERAEELGGMGPVRVWHSNNNNRFQVRLLGPLRIVPLLREVIGASNGMLFAKSFFEGFMRSANMVDGFGKEMYPQQFALYKESNTPDGGILGFQFEVCFLLL